MTAPATWAIDEHLDPVHLNSRIYQANKALATPCHAILWGSPDYSYTGSSSVGAVHFSSGVANGMTVRASGSNRTGAVVTEAGWYSVELNLTAQVDGGTPDSHFIAFVMVNGFYSGRGIFTARSFYQQSAYVHRLLDLKAGDVITAAVFTDAGRKVSFGLTDASCRLSASRISDSPWEDAPALPPLKTWQPRELATPAIFNEQVRDVQKFLRNPPHFSLTRSKSATIAGGTTTNLPWDNDSLYGFTASKNSSGEIIGVRPNFPGRYLIHGQICGKLDKSVGHLCIYVKRNSSTKGMGVAQYENSSYMDSTLATTVVDLSVTDVISTDVYVSAGRTGHITDTAEQQLASVLLGYWIGATT
ncbi:hypothetical protein [Streptomyces noursei]|uniref:hypothetical protein n=1 Tax=Streptomyces noursei TaxID=1971 RepID=UPI001677383D|nr:hypothetical protein [Streptomyces noursei]MCZ1015621.1 hypothetical protein [Streptomyces noursei]GGW89519.1 hypothetical protein GCM10010341_07940 [Streptomyces noursei]